VAIESDGVQRRLIEGCGCGVTSCHRGDTGKRRNRINASQKGGGRSEGKHAATVGNSFPPPVTGVTHPGPNARRVSPSPRRVGL
jgi:hypothetical protein